jgi:FAD/FMN-containing dehydrogenase
LKSGILSAPKDFRGRFRTDDAALAVYSEAAGIGRVMPLAVAVAHDTADVIRLIQWSQSAGVAVIPRGSGSSMAGGAIGAGVVLDVSRLGRLDGPDPGGRSIRAGAGVIRGQVNRRALTSGLRFPVDPSSGEFCTIGGMAATNAAGPHSLQHGSMRPWVLGLECVFEDGSRATVERGQPPPTDVPAIRRFMDDVHSALIADTKAASESHAAVLKNSSGYAVRTYSRSQEMVDLLVGSEGTLCVFTSVEVALTPTPAGTASLFVSFRDLERAVSAAVAAREHGASACELLDQTFLRIAATAGKPLPVAPDAEAALLVEVESAESAGAARADADRLRDMFRSMESDESIVSIGPGHEAELWSFRHAASPAIAKMHPSLRSMQFIEDAAVPPQALASYVRGVRAILARNDTVGVIFGHAGDAHVHVNPLVDVDRPDWRERVERILVDCTDLVASLGGTTTGEHGDGRLRTPLLDRTWSAVDLERFARIKRAFDPENRMNPGVKLPLPGQRAIDVVKYDPSLAPLPVVARQALEVVERERAYARPRLELL